MENKKNRLGNLYLIFLFIVMYLPLGFLIFSIFLAKVQKVNFDLKNIKYKKLTIILLLVFVVLNLINTI